MKRLERHTLWSFVCLMAVRGVQRIEAPALIVLLLLLGCGSDRVPSAPRPSTAVVQVAYAAVPAPPCTAETLVCFTGCGHSHAPAQGSVYGSWGEGTRLIGCGNGRGCATFTRVPVDTDVWLSVTDINQCCRDCSGNATSGVSANSVRLSRLLNLPNGTKALAFRVDAAGVVQP